MNCFEKYLFHFLYIGVVVCAKINRVENNIINCKINPIGVLIKLLTLRLHTSDKLVM